jgi:hypothetical protein
VKYENITLGEIELLDNAVCDGDKKIIIFNGKEDLKNE